MMEFELINSHTGRDVAEVEHLFRERETWPLSN